MIRPAQIELQIDELVLHGVAERDGEAVGDAFTRELTRLLTEHGVPEALGGETGGSLQVTALDGVLDAAPGIAPDQLGARAARSVFAGMGGTGS
ncbi:MAG: hypothetical protein K0Q72_1327 [Armatimonadetes bacterium]|jgi:hypothetical protein|nr:hypothetical protein [Armatimonadota bacterium]